MTRILMAMLATFTMSAAAGSEPYTGSTSVAEFAAAHFAQDHDVGDGPRSPGIGRPTSVETLTLAVKHFAIVDEATQRRRLIDRTEPTSGILSTSEGSLAAFAREKLSNHERGSN